MNLLGLDVGTSGCKAVLFDGGLNRLAAASRRYEPVSPQAGEFELDPDLVWRSVLSVLGELGPKAEAHGGVLALCCSVSGDEVIPVSAAGEALYPCIMAADVRTQQVAARFEQLVGREAMYRQTGLPCHPMHPLFRMMWLRDNYPQLFAKTARVMTWGEWIATRLGADWVTDESLACRSMAYDLGRREWSSFLLEQAGIDQALLPPIAPTGTVIGAMSTGLRAQLGWSRRPLVALGGFDQPMAVLGAGAAGPGAAVVCTGTWEVLTVLTGQPLLSDQLLAAGIPSGRHVADDACWVMTSSPAGGSVIEWFQKTFAADLTATAASSKQDLYDLVLAEATAEPAPVLAIPHLLGTYNPWMNPNATGALLGLTVGTTRGDILRALLEGITFDLKENLDRVRSAGVPVDSMRATGGGARSSAWLQLKADVTGVAIETVSEPESGCLAAAALAGVGAGLWSSASQAVGGVLRPGRRFEPSAAAVTEYYQRRWAQYRQTYQRLAEPQHPSAHHHLPPEEGR
jgi:xylulokinase